MQQSTDFRPSDLVGTSIQRREDPDLISGGAEYTDDICHPDGLHLALCRSQYGHARIESIETAAATALDGVVAAYTAADIEQSDAPGTLRTASMDDGTAPEHPLLARETVTFQGQPVAAVVAEDRYAARDAVDAVDVTYDRRPSVVDPVAALADDAPTIHEEAPDNVAFEWDVGDEAATEAALGAADNVVDVEIDINRVMPTAMEPRAAAARYDESTGDLSVALTTQNPHEMRGDIAETLGVSEERIDARSPDVGGGFGGKLQPYPGYVLTAWCALERERSINWTATRAEDLLSMVHSREHQVSVRVAVTDDGRIEGLRADTVAPVGGFVVPGGALVPKNIGKMANGQYDIPAVYVDTTGVFSNTAPLSAYRGAGRPEATYVIERVIRETAGELDIDPVELRRRNFVRPEQFPFETGLGRTYDSGDYEKTLAVALDRVDYQAVRDRQERLRDEGRYLGIGVSAYVEACGVGPGTDAIGGVEITPDGTVVVRAGTAEIGTGHRTAYAQVAAAELDIPLADVDVREGDTTVTGQGKGTFGSRAMPLAGNAIKESARTVRERARRVAAGRLEASEADVALTDGEFHVRGAPDRSLSLSTVAELAEESDQLPADGDSALDVTSSYDPPNYTFPFGTHVAIVEVDPDTGDIDIERYVAVDDVGTQINPGIVEGQVQGGIAQGLGQALYEEATYDDNGTLLRGSLQDYALPKADDVPEVEWTSTTTPSPHNPLGVKGVGEAGTIAAPPALVNAVADALEPLGVGKLTMPLTQEQVWQAIDADEA